MFESIIFILFVVISVVLHEFAHGYVSYKLGDPTPKIDGRLSLDPRNHINEFGFGLMIILVLLQYMGYGGIGMHALGMAVAVLFAKPVLVNPSYYKNPLRDEMLVSLAGPITNFLLAIFAILIMFFFASLYGYNQQPMEFNGLFSIFHSLIVLNIVLGAFNLLPIPPLDGFSILAYFFPSLIFKFKRYNNGMLQILFIFLILGPFSSFVSLYLGFIVDGFYNFFYTILSSIFY